MIATRRHPAALPYLFFTEMWERFGFYVVQGILVLYLIKAFGFSDTKGYGIAGAFAALAYIAPILGGLVADKILGFKLAIVWGGIFLIAGYALLAFPGTTLFYAGLATIIVGTGLFKPNISTLLGALYQPGDSQREAGFTLFYIGINIGVLLSGTSDLIRQYLGWHIVFVFASVGLFLGLMVFFLGISLGKMKYDHATPLLQAKFFFRQPFLIIYCLIIIAMLSVLLQRGVLEKWVLPLLGVVILVYMFILAYRQESHNRKRLLMLNILIISSVLFWAIFLQMFFSVSLFIDRLIDKQILGMRIPTTLFYTQESIFVILLGPLFAWMWQSLIIRDKNPSPLIKFFFSLIFVGITFLILTTSTYFTNTNNLINPIWITLAYLFLTIGEMLLYPIGLSAVSLLSPPQLTGVMMGIWFVALGYGGEFAGMLAKIASIPESSQNAIAQLPIYRHAFLYYTCLAFAMAGILFIVRVLVRKSLEE
jgi:POT family proton-dependent oligopeptide transporter